MRDACRHAATAVPLATDADAPDARFVADSTAVRGEVVRIPDAFLQTRPRPATVREQRRVLRLGGTASHRQRGDQRSKGR